LNLKASFQDFSRLQMLFPKAAYFLAASIKTG
jgi:hypothetical protein